MTKDEAMRIALEALVNNRYIIESEINLPEALEEVDVAIAVLRQALEQPEKEPVAYLYRYRDGWTSQLRFDGSKPMEVKKLYTAPPKREWVGLTDEEILEAAGIDGADTWVFETARAIEAKLKDKNRD